MDLIQKVDFMILDFIQENLRTDFLDSAVPYITSLGDKGWFWICAACALIIIPKTRKIGIAAGIALIFSLLITNMTLKPLVERIRPYDINTAVELLIRPPSDYSFPSGHTSASFAAASAIFFMDKKIGIPALILAAVIGLTRLYLYVHFPTDVLGGAAVGIFAGYIAVKIVNMRMLEDKIFSRL
ncbi:MAG: phosphatase PAP2 family protein [Firmicutes bacterium]|nr:phosphatase PAP2 family protein [Bacillota bacterium]